MRKEDFDNQLRKQCFDIPNMCERQIEGIQEGLEAVPEEMLREVRRVILTGCGDSYLAGIAAVPAFKRYGGAFACEFEAVRCMDAARYLEIDEGNGAATLVVGISASGGPARVAEALKRAGKKGCHTVLVTNEPKSPAARQAEHCLTVHTPPFETPGPGLRNYYASVLGLFALAVRFGRAKGLCGEKEEQELYRAVRELTGRYEEALPKMDSQMFELACQWKEHKGVETIGDGAMFATAGFIGAKYTEAAGLLAAATDSENWCHVNYFKHSPERLGVVALASIRENNRSRMQETLRQAEGIGRPVLLITDCEAKKYGVPESVTVCSVPETEDGFEFTAPLLNYIPGALLAAYIAAMRGEPYFRAADSPQKQSRTGCTIQDSHIETV